jgi:hypothetical protein
MRRVRLTRILSRLLNGFDLSKFRVGEVVLVPEAIAAMLMAERWAEPEPDPLSNDQRLAEPTTSRVLIGVPRGRARNVTVRIVRQPRGQVFGIALDSYRVGRTYEVTESVAEYLVLAGFALVERRTESDRPMTGDRRRRTPARHLSKRKPHGPISQAA